MNSHNKMIGTFAKGVFSAIVIIFCVYIAVRTMIFSPLSPPQEREEYAKIISSNELIYFSYGPGPYIELSSLYIEEENKVHYLTETFEVKGSFASRIIGDIYTVGALPFGIRISKFPLVPMVVEMRCIESKSSDDDEVPISSKNRQDIIYYSEDCVVLGNDTLERITPEDGDLFRKYLE